MQSPPGQKRKEEHSDDQDETLVQSFLVGKEQYDTLRTNYRVERSYLVEQGMEWSDLAQYPLCYHTATFNIYRVDDFVFVANSHTPEERLTDSCPKSVSWIAQILEIRAADEECVYARVVLNELIASNHLDIIDFRSVCGLATVVPWADSEDEEIPVHAWYWRQAYDCRT
ncbi:uncharacterized protein LMH87_007557 [Akanthomyces muscarius]|uniref:Uncharacterized protein n=1 Tax=Akanthomyces muscarius TaxID=2231603 RepID=A0A9W8QKG2_AKAMU|nr:uncharacterized protein LMH87_007557 [Akanthomyces muscarius]KAJ4161521.1 hypothetical protein LMH87_007557 [Akanthomyces muscarius]